MSAQSVSLIAPISDEDVPQRSGRLSTMRQGDGAPCRAAARRSRGGYQASAGIETTTSMFWRVSICHSAICWQVAHQTFGSDLMARPYSPLFRLSYRFTLSIGTAHSTAGLVAVACSA
jgi:hypothetical protein